MLTVPGFMQLTLVSYYGDKPPELVELVRFLQDRLAHLLGASFRAYQLEQVHGTIIGLEGCLCEGSLRNLISGHEMDLAGVLRFLKGPTLQPIEVRIGGYRHPENYSFQSRSTHPYLRSFSIQGDIAVAMGWPVAGQQYPDSLDKLRRHLREFGVQHKWHKAPEDVDNDFFFVLGKIDRRFLSTVQIHAAAEEVRAVLAGHPGTLVTLSPDTMWIVGYLDPQLPPETSCWFALGDGELPGVLRDLYPVCV